MGSEWKEAKLKDVGIALLDCVHKTPKALNEGYPYITIPQLQDGRINFEADTRLISEDDLIEWTKKVNPTENDVVLSRRCNPGETAFVPRGSRFALGQNLVLIRSTGKDIFPPFLRWLVQGRDWWNEVEKFLNVGAVFDSLRCADIPSFELPIPPLPEQHAIAHILGSLDDKIELNRRMNATLEGMAQALFKSWFVDFDPVLDNALVAGNSIPEELADRAEVRRAALANGTANREAAKQFPAAFEVSEEFGWIPEGWKAAVLGDYLEIKRGGSPRPIHDFICPEGLPWVKIADATKSTSRFLFETKEFIKPEGLSKTVLMKKGSLILSNSATPGLPIFLELDACIHDGWLHFPKRKHFSYLFLYQLFLIIREELVGKGNGSVFTNLKTDILRAQRIVVPPTSVLNLFDDWMKPNFKRILQTNCSSQVLVELRDTLLPKLISGELRIPDAEKLAEAALA